MQSKKVPIMGLSIWSTWYEFRIEVWSRQGRNASRLDILGVPHTHTTHLVMFWARLTVIIFLLKAALVLTGAIRNLKTNHQRRVCGKRQQRQATKYM